jgi:hypothetical protein
VAEGGGLLNRYRAKSSIGGSNPPLSASTFLNVPEQAESAETSVNYGFPHVTLVTSVSLVTLLCSSFDQIG